MMVGSSTSPSSSSYLAASTTLLLVALLSSPSKDILVVGASAFVPRSSSSSRRFLPPSFSAKTTAAGAARRVFEGGSTSNSTATASTTRASSGGGGAGFGLFDAPLQTPPPPPPSRSEGAERSSRIRRDGAPSPPPSKDHTHLISARSSFGWRRRRCSDAISVATRDASLDAAASTLTFSPADLVDDSGYRYVSSQDADVVRDAVNEILSHRREREPVPKDQGRLLLVGPRDEDGNSEAEEISRKPKKRLTLDTMSESIRNMQYAVRGPVVAKADQIANDLKRNLDSRNDNADAANDDAAAAAAQRYGFDRVLYTNIGNPQSVGQKPLTWPRQVLALADLPEEVGVNHPKVGQMFPSDAVRRAAEIKDGLNGCGTGAYTHSQGARCFREDVAAFVDARDSRSSSSSSSSSAGPENEGSGNGAAVPKVDPDDIFLTNGASQAISFVLRAMIASPSTGVMIPIPQYPIYSATIDALNGTKVGYHLNEDEGWGLDVAELERTLEEAQESGVDVCALVVINPGNPTGNVLSRQNLKEVVEFCARHRLVLLADEVYQENIYRDGAEFVSCRRAAHDAGLLTDSDDDEDGNGGIELVSFHSVSKGVFGECGRRGGYMELSNIDADVKAQLQKVASSELCSTVTGQIMTSLMVRGPELGDESYESHEAEKAEILNSLRRRSKIVSEGLDSIPGFSCRPSEGSMYCFPSIELPAGAVEEARAQGRSPDSLYAVSLLEQTGICVVPASGFGQKPGRYGFRTTFLPPEEEMADAVQKIRSHHESFCSRYSSSES